MIITTHSAYKLYNTRKTPPGIEQAYVAVDDWIGRGGTLKQWKQQDEIELTIFYDQVRNLQAVPTGRLPLGGALRCGDAEAAGCVAEGQGQGRYADNFRIAACRAAQVLALDFKNAPWGKSLEELEADTNKATVEAVKVRPKQPATGPMGAGACVGSLRDVVQRPLLLMMMLRLLRAGAHARRPAGTTGGLC